MKKIKKIKIKCPVCGNERYVRKDEMEAYDYNHMMDAPFTLVTCGAFRKREKDEDKWAYDTCKALGCCLGQIRLEDFMGGIE